MSLPAIAAFLSSLGTEYSAPLANHLWQCTVFAGAVWLLTLVLRRRRNSTLNSNKLRKTGASRRFAANPAGLMTLMHELGHDSLKTTQAYLADVKLEETKKAVAAADSIPKPKIVKNGHRRRLTIRPSQTRSKLMAPAHPCVLRSFPS